MSNHIPPIDFKKVNKKALTDGLGDVFEILRINKLKISAVAGRDSEGINVALVYILVGAVVSALGQILFAYSLFSQGLAGALLRALIGGVVMAVMSAVVIYVSHMVAANLFKGKATLPSYFRVMGYASLVAVLGVIPVLGGLASIYLLVVNFFVLQETHKLDATNAVLTILVTIGAMLVFSYILGMAGFGGYGMGGMMSGFFMGRPNVIISY